MWCPSMEKTLYELQKQLESNEDCTLNCYGGFKIPIHLCLFRALHWRFVENVVDPHTDPILTHIEIDVSTWTVAELAPIVILLYSEIPVWKPYPSTLQALHFIQSQLRAMGRRIKIPEEIYNAPDALRTIKEFRSFRVTSKGIKNYLFCISSGNFIRMRTRTSSSGIQVSTIQAPSRAQITDFPAIEGSPGPTDATPATGTRSTMHQRPAASTPILEPQQVSRCLPWCKNVAILEKR